jgi:RNA polymerase sigma-70 factor (ECF subfamily)
VTLRESTVGRGGGSASAEATHELYRNHGRQVYAYCLNRLRSREEAEDATQTTFMNAFRALQRGTVPEHEQAWLFRIAHNECLNRRTSSVRRLRVESPNDLQVLQDAIPAPADGDPLELVSLEDALDQMPPNQRKAIVLREWQGLSYREIAAELRVSQNAVEMLIFRARRGLAAALEPEVSRERKRASAAGAPA